MKCPKCSNELRISKKDPSFGLCDNCRKKYRLTKTDQSPAAKSETAERSFSNIPPRHVRDQREQEMRQAYDELLAIGREEKKSKFSFFNRSR